MKKIFSMFLIVFAVMCFAPAAYAIDDDTLNLTDLAYVVGNNDTVGTSFETVNDLSAAVNFLTTASTLEISSSSEADATGGTGAVTIVLEGLDANRDVISETVTMTGQTSAVTVKYFLRINKMYVATSGTTGTNVGDIYCHLSTTTAGVPDTATAVYSMIQFGAGSSKAAVYSTPRKKITTLKSIFMGASAAGTFRIRRRTGSGPWVTIDTTQTNGGDASKEFGYVFYIPPSSDVAVEAAAASSTIKASACLEIRTRL